MTTISELAQHAYDQFEFATKADGKTFVRTVENAEKWVIELAHAAHDDLLPDDWRYETIWDALEIIAEKDATDEDALEDVDHEFADAAVDIYTSARLKWLASNLTRADYCDEADREGLVGQDTGIVDRIGLGQYVEARQVYYSVVRSLTARLEETAVEA